MCSVNELLTQLLFISFFLIVFFVLLNMIMAVIMGAYDEVQKELQERAKFEITGTRVLRQKLKKRFRVVGKAMHAIGIMKKEAARKKRVLPSPEGDVSRHQEEEDGNGLTVKDLKLLFTDSGQDVLARMNASSWEQLMDIIDINGDGIVSLAELERFKDGLEKSKPKRRNAAVTKAEDNPTQPEDAPTQQNAATSDQSSGRTENIVGLRKDIQALALAVRMLDAKIGPLLSQHKDKSDEEKQDASRAQQGLSDIKEAQIDASLLRQGESTTKKPTKKAAAGDAKPSQQSGSSAAPAASGSPADPLSITAAESVMKKRYSAAQLRREVSQPVKRDSSQTIAIAQTYRK
uniref:EF-hand domain-containing protein n=1 Tax=Cryptomonas curvata TaxID=233186 RepID=A0A7S0QCV3_9CRYP|mmetsp:Transcript_16910/g.35742  ORF Transcript_16910/g.35742 Transcript_16910/m.35742 type:complete len:347 (+) Transcript_16910:877-1917(+)